MIWRPIDTYNLPNGTAVLTYNIHGSIDVAHFTGRTWFVNDSHGFNEDGEIYDVTHWMPLPEPPR